jgi:hypothetical protein
MLVVFEAGMRYPFLTLSLDLSQSKAWTGRRPRTKVVSRALIFVMGDFVYIIYMSIMLTVVKQGYQLDTS